MSETDITREEDLPVAVVTGATSGIGAAIVAELERDHQVFALGRDAQRLEELASHPTVTPVRCDLVADLLDSPETAPADVTALVGLPEVHVLVNAAAIAEHHTVAEATPDQWRAQLDLNVVAPAELTRCLLPALRAAQGVVVMINSGAGQGAHPGNTVYAATKHALRGATDGLRKEEAGNGVRVTTVAPGPTDTPMLRGIMEESAAGYRAEWYIQPVEVARAVRCAVDAGPTTQLTYIAVRPRVELADR